METLESGEHISFRNSLRAIPFVIVLNVSKDISRMLTCFGRNPGFGVGALLSMSCLMKSNHCDAVRQMKKIPESALSVSEPNPSWFGNPPNDASNSAWTNKNWLKSRFHFSFAEYHNPHNNAYGVLRVLNDDLVQPNRGLAQLPNFPTSHRGDHFSDFNCRLRRAPTSKHGDLHIHR